jgi:uncharacterized coiled-coil DUF342 family protein
MKKQLIKRIEELVIENEQLKKEIERLKRNSTPAKNVLKNYIEEMSKLKKMLGKEEPKEVEDDKLKSLETEIVNMRRQLKGMRQKVQILRGF